MRGVVHGALVRLVGNSESNRTLSSSRNEWNRIN